MNCVNIGRKLGLGVFITIDVLLGYYVCLLIN